MGAQLLRIREVAGVDAWVAVVSGAGSTVVAGGTIGRWAWGRLVNALRESLARIEHQVTANGGDTTALATRVVRIEVTQRRVLARVRALENRTKP